MYLPTSEVADGLIAHNMSIALKKDTGFAFYGLYT